MNQLAVKPHVRVKLFYISTSHLIPSPILFAGGIGSLMAAIMAAWMTDQGGKCFL